MGKIRVHELAKELGRTSGEVITVLAGMGITDAKPASGIEENVAMKVREHSPRPRASARLLRPAALPLPHERNVSGSRKGSRQKTAISAKAPGGEEVRPKKKKFVAVFRRENARSGVISRMPTKQAQQRSAAPVAHTARPVVRRRPADPALRPADPSLRMARPEEGTARLLYLQGYGPADHRRIAVQPRTGVPATRQLRQCRLFRTTAALRLQQGAAIFLRLSPREQDRQPRCGVREETPAAGHTGALPRREQEQKAGSFEYPAERGVLLPEIAIPSARIKERARRRRLHQIAQEAPRHRQRARRALRFQEKASLLPSPGRERLPGGMHREGAPLPGKGLTRTARMLPAAERMQAEEETEGP